MLPYLFEAYSVFRLSHKDFRKQLSHDRCHKPVIRGLYFIYFVIYFLSCFGVKRCLPRNYLYNEHTQTPNVYLKTMASSSQYFWGKIYWGATVCLCPPFKLLRESKIHEFDVASVLH
jgi:hypothetical protein